MAGLEPDIDQIRAFFVLLDDGGRHAIASEHPSAGPIDSRSGVRGPRWEGGSTFEKNEFAAMIAEIRALQAHGSNVYYSVNLPCPEKEQVGANGKCNADDMLCVRALVFDVDFMVPRTPELNTAFIAYVKSLPSNLKPSLLIDTGGGYHLLYLLEPASISNSTAPTI
jgi:hypothetical protein